MKRLLSFSVIALALAVGASGWLSTTAGAQARAKVTVYKPGTPEYWESRAKMCNDNVKGIYRTQHDGFVHPYGWCLSNVANKPWK